VCDGAVVGAVVTADAGTVDAEFTEGGAVDVEHADRTIATATAAMVRRFTMSAYRHGWKAPWG
jgi:hypothetical protein